MEGQESKPEPAAAPGFATSIAAAISSKPDAPRKMASQTKQQQAGAPRDLLAQCYPRRGWLGSMDLHQRRPRAGTTRPSAQLTGGLLESEGLGRGASRRRGRGISRSPGKGKPEAAERVWRGGEGVSLGAGGVGLD
jgi:hypothetical protein